MEQTIARFGAPGREMLGILTMPDAPGVRAAWLMCNPFGQEAVRSKPMYRVLSDRLAREGCAALRFDYHGSGDSPGEPGDQSLASWTGDLLAADDWLRRALSQDTMPVHWFGMRLGASLAVLAALHAARRPEHLLLWDPVTDGREYCEFLLARHREDLCIGLDMGWARVRRETGEPEPALPGHVLGFEVGPALTTELQDLGPLPFATLLRDGLRISIALEPDHLAHADLPPGGNLERISIASRIDWTTNDASGTAIAPQEVQRAVLSSVARG
jgi:pimeloyl-ACP methyl ester carboxylesterase